MRKSQMGLYSFLILERRQNVNGCFDEIYLEFTMMHDLGKGDIT